MFSPTDKRRALGSFVNTGQKVWNNIHEKKTLHNSNKYHDDATKEVCGIITKFEEPNNTIPHQTNDTLNERQKKLSEDKIIHLIGNQALLIKEQKKKLMIATLQEIVEVF